jgi:hypothetical protein
MEQSNNAQFHADINKMFESYLADDAKPKIMVIDTKKNEILTDKKIDDNVLFDSNLNMYKKQTDGTYEIVNNVNFDAVVVKK